jgi:large subunit ribosomal protein L25
VRKEITVAAGVRATRGKNEARRTRAAGQIPAVIYGAFQDPVSIAVNPREIVKIIHSDTGLNTIFNLAVSGGETTPVMLVDRQVDPVKGNILHADFKRIDLTKKLRVWVPVMTEGEPKGVKQQGGLLEIITRSIEIECLPDDIPDRFVVDVVELMMGQSKRASDVQLAGSTKLVSAPETVIAHVVALRAEEVAEPTAAEAAAATPAAGAPGATAAEPEVIKKGKKEEEAPAEEKGKKK